MITYTDYFVPTGRISTNAILDSINSYSKLPDIFDSAEDAANFFQNILGLIEVAFSDGMNEIDMLAPLLIRFFESGVTAPSEVQWLVLIGNDLNNGPYMTDIGHYIQKFYKLKNANVVVLSGNHCSNIEFAIAYSRGVLHSMPPSNILLLAVNKLEFPQDRLVGGYAIKGDGAGLVFLCGNTNTGIDVLGMHAITNGLQYKSDPVNPPILILYDNYMVCLSTFIEKFKIQPNEINHVIIQNANPLLVLQCLNMLGFRKEQVFLDNLSTFGHLDCLDFVVNLKSLMMRGLRPSTKIISFATGFSGSTIALYLEAK